MPSTESTTSNLIGNERIHLQWSDFAGHVRPSRTIGGAPCFDDDFAEAGIRETHEHLPEVCRICVAKCPAWVAKEEA